MLKYVIKHTFAYFLTYIKEKILLSHKKIVPLWLNNTDSQLPTHK